jgi:hypothetical protein
MRIVTWQAACERFGPTEASSFLQDAIAFAGKRPGQRAQLRERARRVLALSVGGEYGRYGQGWRMAFHDLIVPALYGRG